MTEDQALEAIALRWKASWEVLQPLVPFVLGNEAFKPQGLASYAHLQLQGPIATRQVTQGPVGSRKFERRGTITVTLYGALDAGEAPLSKLLKDVHASLESQTIVGASGTVYMGASSSTPAKLRSWYTRLVAIPFTFYQVR